MLQILVIFYPVDYYRCKKIRYFLDYPVISSQDLSKTAHVKRMEERFTQKFDNLHFSRGYLPRAIKPAHVKNVSRVWPRKKEKERKKEIPI